MKFNKHPNEEILEAMKKKDSLRILFYLKEFNPHSSIGGLSNALEISIKDIENNIEILEKLDIVEQNDSILNPLFKLSFRGNLMMDGLYQDIGEKPKY